MAKGKYQEWLTEEGLIRLKGWAFDGLTDEQIAKDKIGIGVRTLYEWKDRFPQIMQALKDGKEIPDREVEAALYKRACGYEYEEVTEEWDATVEKMIVTKRVKKQVPPDPTSIIFYLKNRKPDQWINKDKLEVSGNINFADVISKARERAMNAAQNNGNH